MKNLYLFAYLTLTLNSLFSQNQLSFFHISPEIDNGYRTIKHTVQDSLGYIWMSQSKGVLKYDGYEFWFHPIDSVFNSTSIDDEIEKIFLDTNGNLLVLSKNGLLSRKERNGSYSQLNNSFSKTNKNILINKVFVKKKQIYVTDFFNTLYLLDNKTLELKDILSVPKSQFNGAEIVDLEVVDSNRLYISTNNGNLLQYTNHELSELKEPFNIHPGIMYLTLDKNNDLWVGTRFMGLFKYDLVKNKFEQLSYFRNGIDVLKKDMILSLFCDDDGIIWAGSDGEGLYKINPKNGDIMLYRHVPLNKSSLSTNSIININQDLYKNLWVISNYGDINILVNSHNKVFHHNGLIGNTSARILSVLKDSNDNIWIGTDGKGLTKKNLKTGKERQFLVNNKDLGGAYIQTITEDENGNVWIGTYKNGLWFYDSQKDEISKILVLDSKGKHAIDILTTFTDSKGRIWVGSDLSLVVYNSKKEKIGSFAFRENGLNGELIRCIVEDDNKNLWIGVDRGGLFRLDENIILSNSTFHNVSYTDNERDFYSIVSMVSDTKGNLWLVDLYGEIHIINTNNKSYKKIGNSQLINDISFHTILMENPESLWLGSNNGLWNLNIKDSSLVKYTKADGFFSDYYAQGCAYKDKSSGFLYFGGLNGVDGFDPKNISKVSIKSQLYINAIEILNKPALSIIPEQVSKGIENTKLIELKNNQSSFSFKFSVVGTVLNTNYLYKYRLKGFDDEWKFTKNNRMAAYTNIPWGEYDFEVKASTVNENIPLKSIKIVIKPPLWMHPWAFLLYVVIFCALVFSIYKWILLRKKLFSQKIKNEQESKIYYEKMNFFSKMSHEIQTPLALIMGPVGDILKKSQVEKDLVLNQRLRVIFNNAKRLSRIANLLTTVRNKEIGQLKLRVLKKDIIKEIKEISDSFHEQARFKRIDFKINNFAEEYMLWFDNELLEHMIYNLLSNAFKYTPSEGRIVITTRLNHEKDMFEISINDTGYGISKKEYDDIFQLFYRSNKTSNNIGMGIGLAFVKELVRLHKGEINVNSKKNKGSTFTIVLPLNEDKYSDDEKIESLDEAVVNPTSNVVNSTSNVELLEINTKKINSKKDSILIIEDNYEMQHFLCEVFNENYNVYSGYNGKEGVEIVKQKLPDIIISDISMPVMNGLEMCKIIQKDNDVSHIPIIFLTAKNSTRHKLKGLKYGAIEFMCKPFDINELHLKVNSILVQNKRISSKVSLQYLSTPENIPKKSKDSIFLESLISILNSKLEDPDFKLENLALIMSMSYSNIYRNCQKLTGKTITELFRLLRLKRAAVLIVQNKYNVSEACFAVGFNDTRYFSKCFKEQFKMTPTVFKNESGSIDLESFLAKYELSKTK
ncbi:hybrid sensor histidine kinase/response regulator transcription factor [Flavivirga jejuensis]|uniref:histidine kinase n=1 Tax=Flavivirga jejuensis TaxID=870487 RepID=A0ABT8WUZ2_9FLAO|nr:hybrid sensor histidine kinase/response regulator transcription factor [Flavivirga jejuensis]MDO5976986.1 response regulator [Flavivirga jejuensis]